MAERDQINTYLQSLNRYLSRLAVEDANEVIREIESHIYDAIEQAEAAGEELDINHLLQGFGSPRALAEQYTNHVLEGAPPPAGFSAITAVKHKATKGLYWGTMLIGYGLGVSLIILAIAKLLCPESVGVWPTPGGQSFIVGMIAVESQPSGEMLQGWLVPIAAVLGGLTVRWTYKLSQILKRLAG